MECFKIDEFKCKCGCGEVLIQPSLMGRLNDARHEAGVPFIITSGYRCKAHNIKIGGKFTSSHVKGFAVDIAITDDTKDIILNACKKYFTRIGIAKTFIHVDCDHSKPDAVWFYNRGG